MVKCTKGEIQIKGYGSEVSAEVGCIMNYFFENCTAKEAEVALDTFKEKLSEDARRKFISALAIQ